MKRLSLALAALLLLSGCAVADGVAHLVKLGQRGQSNEASAAPSAAPTPTAAGDEAPPPPPAPRDSIQVEQLGPPHG